ncbi:hypothetical protein [Brasilonema sp. UFV-L1]|uniref:hypothetical protein n=1 Tax=Brasilonema sp. UFV-L1 TaxID=2234130 RepID=UPI00145E7839|nr:hypothetical protein [Brasilonema sp. UFV-L1]NMG11498.1 hypothetical protein [Brasilonema sp. UFV-L1]
MARHKFFESTPKNTGLVIPEMAVFCRNDCKEGKWMIGETDYGSRLEFLIVHFSRRVSEYMDGRIAQGQIWFTPIAGEVPMGIVYYTLIKNSRSGRSGSLKNFGCQVAIAQSQGYDPRELVWMPKFIKKSGAIEDENGVMQNASWYVIDWAWRECKPEEEKTLNNTVAIIQNPDQMELLFDMDLEATSICVDGMNQKEILALLNQTSRIALPAAVDND